MATAQLNVLYQFDKRYAPFAGVSIFSMIKNNRNADSIDFYIITTAIGSEDLEKIKKMIQDHGFRFHIIDAAAIDKKLNDLDVPTYRGSQTTNYKLFLDEFLPDEVHRILYIDSDTLVTDDLSELMTIDMGSDPIGAVQDSVSHRIKVIRGFDKDDRYYNGGVLLFNMDLWREMDCQGMILDHIQTTGMRYAAPDQDLINIILKNRIFPLDIRYNLQSTHSAYDTDMYLRYYKPRNYYSKEEIEKGKDNPAILHTFRFIGEFPWHKNNVHPNSRLFDEYLDDSPWKGYIKQPSNQGMVFKLEKVLYKVLPKSLFFRIFNKFFERFQKKLFDRIKNGGSDSH